MLRSISQWRTELRNLTKLFGAAIAAASLSIGAAQAQTCSTHLCTEPLTSTVYLDNNAWGTTAGGQTATGTGSITANSSTSWSTAWNYNNTKPWNVDSFPCAILGWFYGQHDTGTGMMFPVSANTPVNGNLTWSITASGPYDVAYDNWYQANNNWSNSTPTDELMIWMGSSSASPVAYGNAVVGGTAPNQNNEIQGVVIDGLTWDVFWHYNTNEGTSGNWSQYDFVKHNPNGPSILSTYSTPSAALNFSDFSNWCVQNGHMSSAYYFSSVMFGVEMYSSSAGGNNTGSLTVSNYTAAVGTLSIPAAPTGLTATPGNADVALSWSASSSATSYNVLRSTVSGSGYASVATDIMATSYTNFGLTNGTTYYFVVTATNSAGTSGNSSQASAKPQAAAPAPPTGLTATPGNDLAALSWTASYSATSYNVKRSTVNGSGYATVGSPAGTTFTNTGLTNGTTYYYVVTAVNVTGESANSSQVSAIPLAAALPVQINAGGPAVAPFLADVDFSGGSTATNWTGTIDTSAVTNPAPQAVYQSERWGTSTYSVGGLTPGTNYKVRLHFCENYFTVAGARTFNVAINGNSELASFDIYAAAGAAHKAIIKEYTVAANSSGQEVITLTSVVNNALINGVEVTTAGGSPPTPTGLAATPGNALVTLNWTASSGATSYNVKGSTTSGGPFSTWFTVGTNSATSGNLTNGTTYYFVVSAVNSSGESGNSNQASATPSGSTDTAQYSFESGLQGWIVSGLGGTIAQSSTQVYHGSHSMAVNFNGTASGTLVVSVSSPSTPAGGVVTSHIWIPAGSKIVDVKPYVSGVAPGYAWSGNYYPVGSLTAGAWNTITQSVPASGSAPLSSLGIEIDTNAAWTGTCYVDSVSW